MAGVEHNGTTDGRPRPKGESPAPVRVQSNSMANDLLIPEESQSEGQQSQGNGHELDALLGRAFEEKPIWRDLYENIHDLIFPPKLPPLELTSTPIPVPDRMASKTSPWAFGISMGINGLILVAALVFGVVKVVDHIKQAQQMTDIDVGSYKMPQNKTQAGGGGGGGDHSKVDPSKGHLPKIEPKPMIAPQVHAIEHPLIPMEAAINVQKDIVLPDNPALPNIGVKSSVNVKLASNGTGGGGGMGSGYGGGLGSGNGNGYGSGSGGNAGGGLYKIGGNISKPIPIYQPEAEFSDEARRNKYQGVVVVALIVDAQGNPQNVHVLRSLGMGLDEKAVEAVRKYKFKPAMKDGHTPVPVAMAVQVNFNLY